jgi:hypothetical protein
MVPVILVTAVAAFGGLQTPTGAMSMGSANFNLTYLALQEQRQLGG